ncbi:CDP-alcohol phosphatidyltransferase family protein [Luteipulveratus sp. YIM 133132]|uniref:CDP-alcohol phosphatidyltransferase family protein n=1 Tax=Luteipulveratus flavus TaxID=3031728 RepID=A0ABT6CBH4_9MICO|nr:MULTISPECIES: CDP-alcohol phosphatidyltransferase family protein [unclassified Luteipulveratus]MDE9367361.1 CDP-alcohol phosphatidyltransferase family protein [Luteipulveratus sp. YIM 133132]MDF8266258.1 CDP-alcohol phosphatidyltransferase family protein [Luteipulveratus sp. YIM 133296]
MTETGTGAAREPVVSGRVWTVPNALSMLRLVGVPVFLWLILTEHDTAALIVLALSGVTDYLDGKIARRYGLISRLGQLLDPIADRLYILSTLLGLAWRDIIPWWLVAVLLSRELFVLALGPSLRRHQLAIPPVHFVGKAATFNLIYAFPLLLLAEGGSVVADIARPMGWAFAWWGTGLYWLAAVMYAAQIRGMVKHKKAVSA